MSAAPVPRTAVARARLASQGLLAAAGQMAGPDAVVRHLGLVQAQDLGQAFWALGARAPGSTASTVRTAFDDGAIVRTWAARGTLMLVAPELLDDVLTVTGPRMRAQTASGFRAAAIDAQDIAALVPVATACCANGATRAQLLDAIRASGQDTSGQRGYHLLMALSLARAIVQGPMAAGTGVRQLFVPYRDWTGATGSDNEDPAASLARVALRYFGSHGPATAADFAWWLGLPLTPVRAALGRLEANGGLLRRELEGTVYWMGPGTAAALDEGMPRGSRSLLALAGFDELLLGYRDRGASLPAAHAPRVVPGGNGVFRRTIVHGGATIGTWDAAGGAEFFVQPPGPAAMRSWAVRMQEYSHFWAR